MMLLVFFSKLFSLPLKKNNKAFWPRMNTDESTLARDAASAILTPDS